jgi:hypothetical protein
MEPSICFEMELAEIVGNSADGKITVDEARIAFRNALKNASRGTEEFMRLFPNAPVV